MLKYVLLSILYAANGYTLLSNTSVNILCSYENIKLYTNLIFAFF